MADFRMPSLGADMDVGTIVQWLVGPGDTVRRGQIVAVVDTAKAAIEIEAFQAGVVEEIIVGTGVEVPVGTPLARIAPTAPNGPVVGAPAASSGSRAVSVEPDSAVPPLASPPVRHLAHQLGVDLTQVVATGPHGRVSRDDVLRAAPPGPLDSPAGGAVGQAADRTGQVSAPKRVRATPRARRLAAELDVDLAAVAGSGAGGVVLGADIQRSAVAPTSPKAPQLGTQVVGPAAGAARAGAAQPGRQPSERKAAMRAAIASLMARSAAEIPHYYVSQTIDLSTALAWLRAHNSELPAQRRVLPAALFLRATVIAAQKVPDLNGHWVDGGLQTADQVDLGVAVATRGGGLVTPAIPDAGQSRIDELMARLADLVRRARVGTLRQAEMVGGTITVSSLGEDGPDSLHGVIFPPQVALVCVGAIHERPWAVNGMLTVRPIATVTIAADHRASDGRTASAFLATLSHALEHPEEL